MRKATINEVLTDERCLMLAAKMPKNNNTLTKKQKLIEKSTESTTY